ncbi:MFS transporter [Aeromicrobium choanae]|uniref:Predicted arabinose efflux permease, MFS family n=1 Tax=Aeromicrobium choanae TaxID=1736691 RepID=A0A1T4Z738_9ACTN|nr:MFS transporter [Aeromicrobium choanae]SKB09877.1 Predicted arabinose efflux permease, MFS family [Aeromicrobium choanae]
MSSVSSRRDELALSAAGLCLIGACYGLARFAYGLFVPAFRDEFTLGAAAAGTIAAGGYVVYCAAILASSTLTPRLGGRAVAVAAGSLATTGTLTIALAPSTPALVLGVLLGGASTGVVSPALAHAVAHTVAQERQGRIQTVINAGTGMGVAIAGPIALLTQQEWRAAWLAFAALSALATLGAALRVPRGERSGEREPLLPRPLLPAGSARLTVAAALAGVASAAVWTFGRDLMVTDGGLSEQGSTIAWILLGAFGVMGAAAGDLSSRYGLRAAWTATALVLSGATAAVAAWPGSLVAACLAMAAFGAAYIAASGLLLLWGTRVHPRSPAAGVGWGFLVLALGQAVGSVALGAVAEASSTRLAFAVAAVVAVAAAAARPRGVA